MKSRFLVKTLSKLFMLFLLLFMIIVLLNVPKSMRYASVLDEASFDKGVKVGNVIVMVDGGQLKEDVADYLKTLASGTLGKNRRKQDVSIQIKKSTMRTLKLMLSAVIVSLVLGVIKGVMDSKRSKGNVKDLKLVSTVLFLSLPDIITILLLQSMVVVMAKAGFKIFPVIADDRVIALILPVLVLSVIPLNYISRITAISIENVNTKPYITTAIGKGASKVRVLWVHIFRNAIIEIVSSFSSIAAMIFSSLLLVEYMFAYPGIAYTMFEYFRDTNVVIAAAIVFALLFYVIDLIFSILKYMLMPVKETA